MASSRRRQPVQKRAQDTIAQILDTAAHLLGAGGYHELSTNQIADAAHISIGTVYRYFADKADIVSALRARSEGDIMNSLIQALAAASVMNPADGVRRVLTALVDALERHRGVITAVVNDLPLGIRSNVLPTIEGQLHHIARLALMQRYPQLSTQDVDEMLYLGMGIILHAALRIAIGRPPHLDRESLIDRVVAIARGVRLPAG